MSGRFPHPRYHPGIARRAAAGLTALLAATAAAGAQSVVPVSAGGEIERYLRVMQLAGRGEAGQWTLRPFARAEVSRRHGDMRGLWPVAGIWSDSAALHVVAPSGVAVLNTGFPYGFNDGPMWAGRGLTASMSGGVSWRRGSLVVRVAPTVFVAQNISFRLAPSASGLSTFSDWLPGNGIDLPQRFGDGAYGRIDAGESRIAVESAWVGGGLSSEAQVWGPAIEHPIILGNNAGGFPHFFLESPQPVNVGIGRASARIVWGRLDQSPYFGVRDSATTPSHFATGAVGTLQLDWPRGLEVGAARFFHSTWGSGKPSDVPWFKPFEEVFKDRLPKSILNPNGDDAANQLASVFFRFAPPGPGVELYGEYGREDHAGDLRDFLGEPDHDAAYMIGIQRAWSGEGRTSALRWELLNSRISHLTGQSPWYMHGYIRQGHTLRGQILGAASGYGGGGSTLAFDRYTARGRSTIRLDRTIVAELRQSNELPVAEQADVMVAARYERVRFGASRMTQWSIGVVREMNRHFTSDAWNLNAAWGFTLMRGR